MNTTARGILLPSAIMSDRMPAINLVTACSVVFKTVKSKLYSDKPNDLKYVEMLTWNVVWVHALNANCSSKNKKFHLRIAFVIGSS